jgi:hypothetical protein
MNADETILKEAARRLVKESRAAQGYLRRSGILS